MYEAWNLTVEQQDEDEIPEAFDSFSVSTLDYSLRLNFLTSAVKQNTKGHFKGNS